MGRAEGEGVGGAADEGESGICRALRPGGLGGGGGDDAGAALAAEPAEGAGLRGCGPGTVRGVRAPAAPPPAAKEKGLEGGLAEGAGEAEAAGVAGRGEGEGASGGGAGSWGPACFCSPRATACAAISMPALRVASMASGAIAARRTHMVRSCAGRGGERGGRGGLEKWKIQRFF